MLVLSLIGVFLAMVATLALAGQNTTAFFGTWWWTTSRSSSR